jgi:hypothetical protein
MLAPGTATGSTGALGGFVPAINVFDLPILIR